MHIAIVGPANPAEFAGDLYPVDCFPEGMGGRPVNELVRTLLDMGHRVSLFTCAPGQDAVWKARGAKLQIIAVPFRRRARDRALDCFRKERRALARELAVCEADIFHAHWTYEYALACLNAKVVPLLITAHDAPFTILRQMPDPYRLIRTAMALRVRLSTKDLIVVSPYLADRWRKGMLYRRRIGVITNSAPRMDLPVLPRPDHPIILDVANSSALKNVKTLLRAFVAVRLECPDAELRLVGGGLGGGGGLALWAEANGLSPGVKFCGPLSRTELARQYAEATVFCHPSLEESQGICLIEAIGARLPVIAGAQSGAVSWTLFGGKAGLLVNVTRPHEIARALVSTILNPSLSRQHAETSFELAKTRYAPESIAGQYLVEYERLIRQSQVSR